MKIKKSKLVLLVNLGSPERLDLKSIRAFLREFLSDKRVVGLSRFIWYPILYCIILPLRARKLLHKYEQIWHSSGLSPLTYYTQRQNELLSSYAKEDTIVDYAFCYGSILIKEKLEKLNQQYSFDEIIIFPLYPQYSSSTTAAVFDQVSKYFSNEYFIPNIKFINSFATNELYIKALASSIRKHWASHGKADKLLLSFHSIPVKLVKSGDVYIDECYQTRLCLLKELDANDGDILIAFQSKFGKAEWVEPATDKVIIDLAKSTKTIDVICPGFTSDCLETLEEVAITYSDLYTSNGGGQLRYISCLNDSNDLAEIVAKIVF